MLSVVIPALNAGPELESCLAELSGADEIIVTDGGSTDDTILVAERARARVVQAPRGRGVQLQAGAAAATGDWLLFLHADTKLGRGWHEAVAQHIAARSHMAACFRFQLNDGAWQARLLERAVALRVRVLGLPYGDQGLLISRALYEAVGGYRALPLMEDVDLVRRVGRRRLQMLDMAAATSAERWRRDGWLRRSARNFACLALYTLGVSPERIARLYG
ncbi:TIGR04283 family arsenosugar biosynthesis glycosyltransferase [uncultured Sphingomonas sp.]|uniref:TIGR04283 family arsenosugar biosynthesis glycosyltransferase n=1 Tax=uncultured Sphingomonas sp. TaxID=158754 RepID=UPI0025E289E7|nr:TIGR04283 family arsenosugar biosynthesis glycosyltransferase [uncultured Sphingomonas sp.]